MSVRLIRNGLLALCALSSAPSYAQTATAQFNVQLTITAACEIRSASNLNFGSVGVIVNDIDNTSTVVVRCTNGTSYNLGLNAGGGAGASVTTRYMTGPNAEKVAYKLFTDGARTSIWGNTIGVDTKADNGTGADQSFTVYGRVPTQTTPTPGNYSDLVTLTMTY